MCRLQAAGTQPRHSLGSCFARPGGAGTRCRAGGGASTYWTAACVAQPPIKEFLRSQGFKESQIKCRNSGWVAQTSKATPARHQLRLPLRSTHPYGAAARSLPGAGGRQEVSEHPYR